MRRDLERGLNPLVSVLPRYLFAAALATQLAALVIPLDALGDVARVMLGTAVLVGLVALTVLFVDYTTAPVGSLAHRLRGLASAWTSVLVVGFTLAWCVQPDVGSWSVFVIELMAFAGGSFGHWEALRQAGALHGEPQEIDGWPFARPGGARSAATARE